MRPHIAADLTGDNAAHLLSTLLGINQCRWFQVSGVTIASAPARVGDSSAASGVGVPVTASVFFQTPTNSMLDELYDLTGWYVWAATSDKVSVAAVA